MKQIIILAGFILLTLFPLRSQSQNLSPATLTYEDFVAQVLAHHPLARKAELKVQMGEAQLQSAKGAFDPRLGAGFEGKSFDGKRYFRRLSSGLTLPTRTGLKFKGDYSQNDGVFLNPDENLPASGLYSMGVELDLGKGLLIDEARAGLQKARLYQQSTEAERKLLLNDLLLASTAAYWDWVRAYHEREIYRQAVELAQDRLQGVIASFQYGDRPAIDTTEALILVQNRTFLYNSSQIKFTSTRLALSNFLWDESGEPLELLESVNAPRIADFDRGARDFDRFPDSLDTEHPLLRYYALQIQALNVDRRYKAEQLKPKLALQYNFLNGAWSAGDNPSLQNYKVGMKLAFPLFLRRERGDLEMAKLKIQTNQLEFEQKRWELNTKALSLQQKISLTAQQIDQFTEAVDNYERLLEGEEQKFRGGESSVFLVNSREQSLIKARMQLLGRLTQLPVTLAEFNWALGQMEGVE